MRRILAIAHKELSTYFTTAWAYVVFTVIVLVNGFVFSGLLQTFRDVQSDARRYGWSHLPADLSTYKNLTDGVVVELWSWIAFVSIFVVPFLSMRLFAEEKRQRTFELLMTVPVRPFEIVAGKYLGGLGIVSATLGMTLAFPLILSLFGSSESGTALEWSTVLLGYFGVLLWGATCLAVGLFISALTESQMLAALVSIFVLFPLWVVKWLAHTSDEPWRSLAAQLSVADHLHGLSTGVLDLKGLVLFASIIFLSLLLTQQAVEVQRWT